MRTFTRSWIAYLLLFILTVAFAIWGIKDVFRNVGSDNLVEIGGDAVTPQQLTRELDNALKRARASGHNVTREEAIAQGAHMQLLEQLVAHRAVAGYARQLGVAVGDENVRTFLTQIPGATNPVTGRLDPAGVAQFAQAQGYSSDEMIQQLRDDLTSAMLMSTLEAGVRAPQSYGELLYSYGAETRVVTIAEAPASSVAAVAPPTDAQLQAFWQENQDALRVPEHRHLTVVYARAADFMNRVNITDEQLHTEFDARRDSLTTPERRSYTRVVATSQAQANDVAARINGGQTPQAVATALHLQILNGQNEARTEVPDARVADAVFSTPANAPARAVQGQLNWAVVRVTSITPGVAANFDAARDQIRTALANDKAADLVNTAVTAFEDARSAGTPAAQAARQVGLTVVDIPEADAQGRDAAGNPIAAFTGQAELLRTAFATPQSEASDFTPVADGDAVVAVEGITPARVRPLAEVRGPLTQRWIANEQARRLREKGEQFVAAVRGGQNFAAYARAQHFNVVVPSRPLNRQQASQIPSRGLPEQIFAAHEGDVLSDVRGDGATVLVAIVEHINRADMAAEPQQVEAARAQMQQSLGQSFDEALQAQLVANAHPRRNEELIRRSFQANNNNDQDQQ